MASLFTHPAVVLTRTWFPSVPRRAVIAAVIGSMLPDADAIGYALGIPYGSLFGHRGFTHSIVFALLYATLATLILRVRTTSLAFLFLCTLSHPVLDAMTNGGRGVAFFSPFSNHRYFFPWRPIQVSPISTHFFNERGLRVIASEVVWVWIPCAALALLGKYLVHVQGEAGEEG